MKALALWAIGFYQRQLSPRKGYRCAHHQLYRQETCSNFVKRHIAQHGCKGAWPKIRQRFKECRHAAELLHNLRQADLPCDVSFGDCDICSGLDGDTGSKRGTSVCSLPCDIIFDCSGRKRQQRQWALIGVLSSALLLSYWFYGRQVTTVIITDHNPAATSITQSIWQRLTEREQPRLRVMLEADGKKFYSEIQDLAEHADAAQGIIFEFKNGPLAYSLQLMEVQDARLQLGGDLMVIGQVLEAYPSPAVAGQGERFEFQIKRRWHLW